MNEKHTLGHCGLPLDVLIVFILFHCSGHLSSLFPYSLDIAGRHSDSLVRDVVISGIVAIIDSNAQLYHIVQDLYPYWISPSTSDISIR